MGTTLRAFPFAALLFARCQVANDAFLQIVLRVAIIRRAKRRVYIVISGMFVRAYRSAVRLHAVPLRGRDRFNIIFH